MTATTGFDRVLTERLAAIGPQELPSGFVDAALDAARSVEQRRPFVPVLDSNAWPSRWGTAAGPRARRLALVVVAGLVLIALLATVLLGGSSRLTPTYRNEFVRTEPIPGGLRGTWPVAMADGRVLTIGGWPGSTDNDATSMASILDPATGTFTRTGDMLSEHDNGVPVALEDGRILVVAGMRNAADPETGMTPPMAEVELYDPATGTFRATASLSSPRAGMTVIRLRDGRVLVAGGVECLGDPDDCPEVDKAELYESATERFTPTGPLARPVAAGQPILLSDGRVLIVSRGPYDDQGMPRPAMTQIYDPEIGVATATASTTRPCLDPQVAARRDSGPLVICSDLVRQVVVDAQGQPVRDHGALQYEDVNTPSTVEVYEPAVDRFSGVGVLPFPADGAVERLDGRIVVYGRKHGGFGLAGQVTWAGLFDPATGSTELIDDPSRVWPLVVALPDGRVALVGGNDPVSGEPVYDAEILE